MENFNIKPAQAIRTSANIQEDKNYLQLRPPYNLLSTAELVVLKAIIQCVNKNQFATYVGISKMIEISLSCIRGHISAIIAKGVPIIKKRSQRRTIYLNLNDDNPPNFDNMLL